MKKYFAFMSTIVLVAGMLFGTGFSYGGTTNKNTDFHDIESWLDQFFHKKEVQDMQIPGAAVVIVKDGKVLLKKGYGYADKEKKILVNPDKTIFRIASVSKALTASALMQLVEKGKIQLNGDIDDYLDEIHIDNPFSQPVTTKHLLTHTTGFYTEVLRTSDITEDLSKTFPLKDYIKERLPKVTREPGKSYMYDNYASTLQGYLVEKISGMPFHDYMKKYIFEPLQMENSDFALSSNVRENLATGYDHNGIPIKLYQIHPTTNPAGSMNTTADDMAKYMIAYLNGGTNGEKRILQNETVNEMNQYHSAIHPRYPYTGFGLENVSPNSDNGQYVIGKSGDLPDFSSGMWFLPQHKLGIFVTYNKQGDLREKLFDEFMDRYYPEKTGDPIYLKTPKKELKKFEGEYIDLRSRFIIFKVTATNDGEILVENGLLGVKSKLKQLERNLFVDELGRKLAFKQEKDETISYFKYLNTVSYSEKSYLPYFRDVKTNSPYANDIRMVQLLGLTKYTEGMHQPNKPITRAELAAMIIRALQYFQLPLPEKSVSFKDVPDQYWAKKEIQAMVNMGLMKGITKEEFAPEKRLSRQETATILIKTFQLVNPNFKEREAKIKDKVAPWAEKAVKTVVALELYGPEVKKYPDGSVKYYVQKNMTRQEAATLLIKSFEKGFGLLESEIGRRNDPLSLDFIP